MIPTWPFVHVPESGKYYWLPSLGVLPSPAYRAMDKYLVVLLTVAGALEVTFVRRITIMYEYPMVNRKNTSNL